MKLYLNLYLLLLALPLSGISQLVPPDKKLVPATVIPFQSYDHLILLEVGVNNKGPYTFILDTGTKSSAIYAPAAEEMELDYKQLNRYGGGRDSLLYGRAKDVVYSLNTVRFEAQKCLLYRTDDEIEKDLGIPIHGIMGSDLFNAFVVEIDHGVDSIRLYDPSTYSYERDGFPMNLYFHNQIPAVKLGVKPLPNEPVREFRCLLHTGWMGTMGLEHKIVERWVGFEGFGSFYFHYRTLLPGHRIPMRTTVVPFLEMWGIKWDNMPLYLSRREKSLAPGYWFIQGVIGSQLLERFNLVFDYRSGVVYASKNEHTLDPSPVSKSGLELRATPDLMHILVDKVHRFSPAADAGIEAGDEVVGIYDIPMGAITLAELRAFLGQGSKTIELYVKRDKIIYKKTFRLRAIL